MSSHSASISKEALEKKKRAEMDRPYLPYEHNIAEKGAFTGAIMPKNIARSGADGMENISDFFRSPEQGGVQARTTSFAALGAGMSPSGPSKANGGDSRGSSPDVENAVNEAHDEDNQEGDDTYIKPQYFPPVQRTPPPQLASSSSRRTPQLDASSLYDAIPSPSKSLQQSPYGSASRIPIASNRHSRPPPSPTDPRYRQSSGSPQSVKKSAAANGMGRSKLSELTNGMSSPRDHDVSMMETDEDDIGVGRDAASPMSRGRPSKVFRSSAAGTDDGTRGSPTYSDEGREEYDPQPDFDQDEQPTQTSATANEYGDDDDEELEARAEPSKKKAGKGNVVQPGSEEEDEAEEMLGSMDDYDNQADDLPQDREEEEPVEEDDDGDDQPLVVKSKKGKGKERASPAKPKPKTAAKKKVAVEPTRKRLADMSDSSDDGSGARRSRRKRFEPLEYWRGEKLVYGRRQSGQAFVPIVKEVLRLPKEKVRSLGSAAPHRARSASVKAKTKRAKREDDSGSEGGRDDGVPPEFGWDANTVEHGVVMDYASKTEIERRIAFPSHLLEYKTMPGDANGFKFQKVFGDASFVAAGMLEIPVGGEKPSKPTKDNTYLFYVIEGSVTVKVHRTSFTMAPGGQFMVPRGNQYSLHTISRRPAKLFFAQARKMAADEEDVAPAAPAAAAKTKTTGSGGTAKKSAGR